MEPLKHWSPLEPKNLWNLYNFRTSGTRYPQTSGNLDLLNLGTQELLEPWNFRNPGTLGTQQPLEPVEP